MVCILAAPIIFTFIALAFHQFWYSSTQINSNIFCLKSVLSEHHSDVWAVKYSADGSLVASGSVDKSVIVRNSKDLTVLLDLKHPSGVTNLSFSPHGNLLASASYDAKVRLWSIPEGKLVRELSGHVGTVWAVDFSPDGRLIASAGEDNKIKLWDAEDGHPIKTFSGHRLNVWDVKFSRDGSKIASGSFDKTIKIWEIRTGLLLNELSEHSEAIVALTFSKDGNLMATASDDCTIRLWNTSDWTLFRTLTTNEHAQAVDFSPDNKLVLTGGRDKNTIGELFQNIFGDSDYYKGVSMRLWDIETGQVIQTFSQNANDVNDVAFSPNGQSIANASSDKNVDVWHLNGN